MGNQLNNKQTKTLKAIFETPTRSDICWTKVVSLFNALGAVIYQGRGSRVRVLLNDSVGNFHEPHPEKEICQAAVKAVREFLERAEVYPK